MLVNEFHDELTSGEGHELELHTQAMKGKKSFNVWTNYPTKRYGFEVYFMGVRLYSKISTRLWPNNNLVVMKCLKVWNDFQEGKDISGYEYISKKKRMEMQN